MVLMRSASSVRKILPSLSFDEWKDGFFFIVNETEVVTAATDDSHWPCSCL